MTFDSSNREEFENKTTTESIVSQIRLAMSQGCVHPCHVFDLVDEALEVFLSEARISLENTPELLPILKI